MSYDLNTQLLQIKESATVALADRVRKLVADGLPVVALQTGDPDFSTPQPIIEAGYRAIKEGLTHYANSRGLPELREAIAQKIKTDNSGTYKPDTEILVTNGGVHAYYCAVKAIANPGDEIIIPDPAWMTHVNTVAMLGCVPITAPSYSENGFWPTLSEIEKRISSKTKAIVINSPNNPNGALASHDYLEQIVEIAKRHNIYIISDEVYEYIIYDGLKHVSIASFRNNYDKLVIVNSFSKSYAMTGWRIGYLAAPDEVISLALKASQNTITNVVAFIQKAALCALTDANVKLVVQDMYARYGHRRDRVVQMLEAAEAPIGVFMPRGAFYAFIDISNLGVSSLTVAEQLLSDVKVSMVPGIVYGVCGEGYLRMTLAASDETIEKGIEGMIKWFLNR